MPAKKIDELLKLKAKLIIDEHANKAARWAARLNTVPLLGGRLGEELMFSQWESMALKLGKLFELKQEQIRALQSLRDSHWVGMRHLWGKSFGYLIAATIPDFGIVTRSIVEDLARSMTKSMGWAYYCIIEEGRIAFHWKKHWSSGHYELADVSHADLKRILLKARSMG